MDNDIFNCDNGWEKKELMEKEVIIMNNRFDGDGRMGEGEELDKQNMG